MPEDAANPAAALLERRRQALLEKWAAGKKLTPDERAEIADHLPRAEPPLRLEVQVVGDAGGAYKKGRCDYAAQFGQSVRTINRWMRLRAPLDDVARLPGWWAETMKHRVPGKVLELARGAAEPAVADDARSGNGAAPTAGAGDAVLLSPLEQARDLANAAFLELKAARAAGDPGRLALAQRGYTQASEQLRRVELADPKIRMASGAVIPREKVRTVLTNLHTSLANSLRSFGKRMRREMAGKAEAEAEGIWQAGLDKLFARFREHDFDLPDTA